MRGWLSQTASAALVIALVSWAPCCAISCAPAASGEVTGGEPRFDAASTPFTTGGWSGLFADMFGPTGSASCGTTGACHGAASHRGAVNSGFVCGDREGCLTSILSNASGPLVKPSDRNAPEKSGLYGVLRRNEDGRTVGIMPKTPPYVFNDTELARIKAWIAAGAPND